MKSIENISPNQATFQPKEAAHEKKVEKQTYFNIPVPKKACRNQK